MNKLKNAFLSWFRKRYENRIHLPHGIAMFIANVAFIQLDKTQYVELNPSSQAMGMIYLTTSDMRPILSYKYWAEGAVWKDDMPIVEVIAEMRGFQVRETTIVNPVTKETKTSEWERVGINDPRVAVLKDLFLASAFYPCLKPEWKKTKPSEQPNV